MFALTYPRDHRRSQGGAGAQGKTQNILSTFIRHKGRTEIFKKKQAQKASTEKQIQKIHNIQIQRSR